MVVATATASMTGAGCSCRTAAALRRRALRPGTLPTAEGAGTADEGLDGAAPLPRQALDTDTERAMRERAERIVVAKLSATDAA